MRVNPTPLTPAAQETQKKIIDARGPVADEFYDGPFHPLEVEQSGWFQEVVDSHELQRDRVVRSLVRSTKQDFMGALKRVERDGGMTVRSAATFVWLLGRLEVRIRAHGLRKWSMWLFNGIARCRAPPSPPSQGPEGYKPPSVGFPDPRRAELYGGLYIKNSGAG